MLKVKIMYCKNCGQQIGENSRFCSHCGTLQKQPENIPKHEGVLQKNMAYKLKKFINENKWFIVCFLAGLFLNIIFLLVGDDQNGFWPFVDDVDIDAYGFVEFFVYVTLPILIFIIIKLVGKDIKKAFDENN